MRKIYFLFLFVLIASMSGLQAAEETIYVDLTNTGLSGSSYTSGSFTQDDISYEVKNIIPGKHQIRVNQEKAESNFYIYNTTAIPGAIKAVKLVNIGGDGIQERYACLATSESAISEPANGIAYGSSSNKVADIQWNVSNANDKFFNFYISGKSGGTVTLEGIEITYEAAAATELTAPVISGVVNGETYYGSALVSISYPDLAKSMTYTITKDGAQYKQETVIVAVEGLELNEVGSYKVEASATDGSQTLSAEAVEFKIVERPADLGTFTKVTDVATLADGDRVIIVCESKLCVMGGVASNDKRESETLGGAELTNNTVILPFDSQASIFTLNVSENGYTFKEGDSYLYVPNDSKTDLTSNSNAQLFSISISDGDAIIKVANSTEDRNIKRNSSSESFGYYAAGQEDVQIYKEVNTEELVAPTIDGVTNGETYYEEKAITITCPTEGAEILYTVTKDGEELASDIATSPIELKYSESGVYEIEAMSSKDEETSEAVTVTFTIKSLSSITSVAEFIEIGKAVGDQVVLQLNCPLTVTYKNARSIYAIDAEGSAIQIFNYNNIDEAIGQTYKAGDVIPAGIQGNLELYNDDTPEITNPVASSFQAATETAEVSPIEKSEISLADVNQYVVVRKVTIAEAASTNNYTLTNGAGTEFAAYQNSNLFFAGEVPVGDGKEYDVTGIVSTFYGNVQITITGIELSVEAGVEGVEAADAVIRANADGVVVVAADAVAEVYNAAGQLVATAAVDGESVIAVPAGFYVVRVGNTIAKVVVR